MTMVTAQSNTSEVAGRRGVFGAMTRLGWGVADQGISSLSNFALGLFVARSYGASSFGAFTLAFVTYTVVLNGARGLATDPLLVRYSGVATRRWRRATSSASGTALAVGLIVGTVCLVAGLLSPAPLGPMFVALGVGLPGLVLQDSFRFAFFASGRGVYAFVNDLCWGVLLILALFLLHYQGQGTAVNCLLAFGVTATLAAVLGAMQARTLPRPLRAAYWVRTHRSLAVRYLVENLSSSGASQLRSFMLGAVASLAAVGYVRASEILMGPFFVVLSGISQVAVPEASRVFHRDSEHLRRFCLVLGGVQAAGAAAWGLIVITIFPLGPGPALLRDLWQPTAQLLPAITLTVIAASFITAAAAGLRAMGVARRSLRAQLTQSALYVIGASVGAILGGALGASWGVTIAQSLSALVWWHYLRRALAAHHADLTAEAISVSVDPQTMAEDAGSPLPEVHGEGAPPTAEDWKNIKERTGTT
jgi:O-antigen/teichoic acid export membrane protein